MGEIIQPTGMIKVKMRQKNMPDISRIMAQPLDLPDHCHFPSKFRAEEAEEKPAQACMGRGYIPQSQAGIDQYQARIGFHENTGTGQPSPQVGG